jgi:uncharacterized protein YndB with AHSA1/START domain
MVPDSIERETLIDAPAERVWTVLTTPEHIDRWFTNAGADVDLRPGGAVRYRWTEHGEFHAVVVEADRPRRLVLRWSLYRDEPVADGNSTRIELTLTPEGAGTRLRVVETGFRALAGSDEARAARRGENVEGWEGGLASIKSYAERVTA